MNRNHILPGLVAIAALCGAPALRAQQTPPTAERPAPDSAAIQALIEQLGAEKNADRREAESALVELGGAARDALRQALEDHDDPEVRWRARRVLRQLDGGPDRLAPRAGVGAAPDSAPEPRGGADGEERVRRMIDRLERTFGDEFGGLRGIEDLQRQMDELRRQMGALHGGLRGPAIQGLRPGGSSQATSIQIGPDGVRVEVQEAGEDGEPETKVYEAKTMDEFRAEYPEVAARVFAPEGGIRFTPFRGLLPFGPRGAEPGVDVFDQDDLPEGWRGFTGVYPELHPGRALEVVPSPDAVAPPPVGEKLGIYLGELAPAVREFLEIPPGQGLLVGSVEDDSLAAELGIRPKDVVLTIGDRDIVDVTDVAAALRGIKRGEEVAVTVNRRGEVLQLTAVKQHDAPDAGKRLRQRETSPEQEPKKR